MGSRNVRKRKFKIENLEDVSLRKIDVSSGTPIYAYNQFWMNMLDCLLNDLTTLETDGLSRDKSEIIEKSLGQFEESTSKLSDNGFFSGSMTSIAKKFKEIFEKWNGENTAETRNKYISKLKKTRQQISSRARRLQFELSMDLNPDNLKACYESMGELIKESPDNFKKLNKQYSRFVKNGGLNF